MYVTNPSLSFSQHCDTPGDGSPDSDARQNHTALVTDTASESSSTNTSARKSLDGSLKTIYGENNHLARTQLTMYHPTNYSLSFPKTSERAGPTTEDANQSTLTTGYARQCGGSDSNRRSGTGSLSGNDRPNQQEEHRQKPAHSTERNAGLACTERSSVSEDREGIGWRTSVLKTWTDIWDGRQEKWTTSANIQESKGTIYIKGCRGED